MDVKKCAAHVRNGPIHFMCLVCNQIFAMVSILVSVLHISELLRGSLVGAHEEKGCVESVACGFVECVLSPVHLDLLFFSSHSCH